MFACFIADCILDSIAHETCSSKVLLLNTYCDAHVIPSMHFWYNPQNSLNFCLLLVLCQLLNGPVVHFSGKMWTCLCVPLVLPFSKTEDKNVLLWPVSVWVSEFGNRGEFDPKNIHTRHVLMVATFFTKKYLGG